jgi:hypothetical protein
MLPHPDTFWANQSLLFLLNAACWAEKQQIFIVFIVSGLNDCIYISQRAWTQTVHDYPYYTEAIGNLVISSSY